MALERKCKTCLHIRTEFSKKICNEGGFTEIGDPDKIMTEEDCNAWKGNELYEIFGEPISVYTSKQAEEDGILAKVKDSHFNFITTGVWEKCIDPFVIKDEDGKGFDLPGGQNNHEAMIKKLLARVKAVILEQIRKGAKPDDSFYKVDASGWTFFVERNETGKFTLLFPEEH